MQISKGKIIEMLTIRGDLKRASKVDESLPDTVDTKKDADLLGTVGLDPREMVNRLPPGSIRSR
jgi:hypothetical protein